MIKNIIKITVLTLVILLTSSLSTTNKVANAYYGSSMYGMGMMGGMYGSSLYGGMYGMGGLGMGGGLY